MKTLKQIKEEYNSKFLDQVDYLPEEISLEESKLTATEPSNPTKNMPAMLIFRRISYRLYPNKQVVALYYSKMLDKYLSIPFGPGGNLNLSEAVVMEEKELEDACWKGYKAYGKKKKNGKLVPNCVPMKETLGSSATRYTERPTYEQRGERPADMAGAVNRGIYEHFSSKLSDIREESGSMAGRIASGRSKVDKDPYGVKTAISLVPGASAYEYAKKGDTKKAAGSAGLDAMAWVAGEKVGELAVKAAKPIVKKIAPAFSKATGLAKDIKPVQTPSVGLGSKPVEPKMPSLTSPKTPDITKMGKPDITKMGKTGPDVAGGMSKAAAPEGEKSAVQSIKDRVFGKKGAGATPKAVETPKPVETPKAAETPKAKGTGETPKPKATSAAGGAGLGAAIGGAVAGLSNIIGSDDAHRTPLRTVTPRSGSSWETRSSSEGPVYKSKYRQAALRENKMSDIRKMVKEGVDTMDISINGREVTLNTSMAKRILEVYDSVNTKNKKIVENMLNEDMESFKKLLNFSIRN